MKRQFILSLILTSMLLSACQPKETGLMNSTTELNEGWQFSEHGKNEWLPATVPGSVHTDLLANEKIEDPFYRLNEHDLQWIDKLDWDYQTTFLVDAEWMKMDRVALDFKPGGYQTPFAGWREHASNHLSVAHQGRIKKV